MAICYRTIGGGGGGDWGGGGEDWGGGGEDWGGGVCDLGGGISIADYLSIYSAQLVPQF